MKREFLEELKLDKETIDSIMTEYGKATKVLVEERDTLKSQIDDANKEIQSYKDMDIDGIKKSAEDWKVKYEEMEKNQKAEKEKSLREARTNAFFNDVKFASESAKAGVISQFNQKDFKYDEESQKFLGASEWLNDLKEKDAGAFLSEVANPVFTTNPTAPIVDSSIDELKEAMGLSTEKNK
nr:MAG TPA: minor structural protein [Caudoviricetes sp.]